MNAKTTIITISIALCLLFGVGIKPEPAQAQDTVSYLLGQINGLRASLGLPPYTLNGTLSAAAQNQANWMAQTEQVSHTQTNGSTPSSRAAAAGYASSWVSENIYMGTNGTAETAWVWWLNSPIHYRGITSTNYTEIGIASGSTDRMRSFVLVFGNPTGWQSAPASASNSGGNSASGGGGLPPYVVGLDNRGNIMHEIQPGHTLGEIALIYGYTWDDLQYIRDLNSMTEEEGRNLGVGAVLLVPPYSGTYTPTPGGPPENIAQATEVGAEGQISDFSAPYTEDEQVRQQFESVSTPQVIPLMPPTATPEPIIVADASGAGGVVVTSAVLPEWVAETEVAPVVTPREDIPNPPIVNGNVSDTTNSTAIAQNWTAATVTPTLGLTEVAMVDDGQGVIRGDFGVSMVVADEGGDGGGMSPMIYIIIGVQIGVVAMAGFEFFRRRGK
ncbi:MAG: CAP domain-containing protein [Aggregatilineales bacterium]